MKKGIWRYFGNGLHNHQNHGFLSRVLLRLWLDAGDDQIPLREKWKGDDNKRVDEVLEEANDRYAQFTRNRISLDGLRNKKSDQFFAQLIIGFALAIVLVYMVMAALFESFIHPFVMLFAIPFAAIGVVGSLLVTNTTLKTSPSWASSSSC